MHEVLVNQLVKFAKKSAVRLTDMAIAVDWDFNNKPNKQTKQIQQLKLILWDYNLYLRQIDQL